MASRAAGLQIREDLRIFEQLLSLSCWILEVLENGFWLETRHFRQCVCVRADISKDKAGELPRTKESERERKRVIVRAAQIMKTSKHELERVAGFIRCGFC